jgi:hypothetical protein
VGWKKKVENQVGVVCKQFFTPRPSLKMQIPAHCGHQFRRIADSVPVIADSRR